MKNLLLCFFIVLMYGRSFAQNKQVTGTITDTSSKQNLVNSSIILLRAKDSVLYKFTRSDASGNFSFSHVDTGKYLLLITEKNYIDYADHFAIKDSVSQVNLGNIVLLLKANLLNEVVVKQSIAAIRMKGDTTEFTADSFKVRQGASVEDMLRILPGLQVDKDGNITAQGQKVKKVLVDGEEFFGDDPTLATKNLQADAIDKVQVFDKKSDQATFTGIDDGEKEKTINLKMKADKKKGYFGKIDLASDFKNRWNNSVMLNSFKKRYKISGYGIVSNTNKAGLDWEDRDKYGGGSSGNWDQDAQEYTSYYDDFSPSEEGLPKSWSAGLNFSNKWNDEKQNFVGSYRYNKMNTEGTSSTITKSLLPGDDFFVNRDSSYNFSMQERHAANAVYDWQIDSSTSAKVTASGYMGNFLSRTSYGSANENAAGYLVNRQLRTTTAEGDNRNLAANAIVRKKFKKTGRTLSLNINERYNEDSDKGLLRADIKYYDPSTGLFLRDSVTNQVKQNNNSTNNFGVKAVYTEPVTKKLYLSINYGIRGSVSESKRLSYDSSQGGKYDLLNPRYSNDYQFNVFTHGAGTALSFNSKKIIASAGTDIGFTNFYQKDKFRDTTFTRNYTNFFPKANFTYKINTNKRLGFNYSGNTQQPSIQQIQPVQDNSDPLFVTIGNPGLKQSFQHSFSVYANSWNTFKERSLWANASMSTVTHAIVTSQTLDTSTGKTTYQFTNSNGNYNIYGNIQLYQKLKKLDISVNGSLGYTGSKYNNIVNGKNNVTTNNNPSVRVGIDKYKEKKYSIWYNYNYGYNFSKSTVQNGTTNYWTQNHSLGVNVTLLKKFEINSNIDYNLRQKTDVFTNNNNVCLWNAYIGRRFLKNDKAIIKITANDLLNQNKGYYRNIESNTQTERNFQIIRRYFTLAFTWNFTKSGAGAGSPSN